MLTSYVWESGSGHGPTLLYAVILEMLLLPLQIEAKRRIIDYMEVDTDAEPMGTAVTGEGQI